MCLGEGPVKNYVHSKTYSLISLCLSLSYTVFICFCDQICLGEASFLCKAFAEISKISNMFFFFPNKPLTAWAPCDKENCCIHHDSLKQCLILHKSHAAVITSKLLYQEEKKCNQTIKKMIPKDYFLPWDK